MQCLQKKETEMSGIKSKIKKIIKFFWEYTIEDDNRVFHLKHTPLRLKKKISGKNVLELEKLPIDRKKIIFENYMGRGFGCNCKYVALELLKACPGLDIVWTVKNAAEHREEFPEGIRLVEYKSEEALREYFTAGMWVSNYHLIAYYNMGLKKREGQCFIQLWHGSLGIKKIERDCAGLTESKSWSTLGERSSTNTDYWISNSTFETEIYKRAFWNVKNVLEYGHPRNDIFFLDEPHKKKLADDIRSRYKLAEEEKIVLYLPTFREDNTFPAKRISADITEAFDKKFNGIFRLAVRRHPRMRYGVENILAGDTAGVLDMTDYPDIQELLCVADALITDYSSGIYDFMLKKKPGFIYAPDIEKYDNSRGFYYSLYDTPFPVATSCEGLREAIADFEYGEYVRRVEEFISEKGCVDDGNAAKRVSELIISKM